MLELDLNPREDAGMLGTQSGSPTAAQRRTCCCAKRLPSERVSLETRRQSTPSWSTMRTGQVDLVMQRIGALQQADEVLDIGRRDMADDLEGAAVGSVCFDAADGGNRFELVHFSLLALFEDEL